MASKSVKWQIKYSDKQRSLVCVYLSDQLRFLKQITNKKSG